MPATGAPVPGPKTDGRKASGALWEGSVCTNPSEISKLRGTSRMLDPIRPVSSSLEHGFVPEEVFRSLTCASSSLYSPEYLQSPQTTKTPMGFKGCLQTPDRIWHYPNRRGKLRHLTDHPVSLTGAGRDVSYLCDAAAGQEAKKAMASRSTFAGSRWHRRGSFDTVPCPPQATLADSLVPKEFHIVKNRGVLPLKYFDDKYTTLLKDREKKLRLFPSIKPSGRLEVIQLMEVMDSMLEKAGVDKLIRVTGPSQLHEMLELIKAEQNIYNIVFHELIRQVSVDCVERGQLLSKLRQRYVDLMERIPEQIKTLYNKMMAQRLVDTHITEELLYFKESVGQLASELCEVQEHDREMSKEAEETQEELAVAMEEAEESANLLEEYRELYELQRRRLEQQILLLARERDIWISAACDLAMKIIDRNQFTLVRRLHVSGRILTNILKHFMVLLASKDTGDLADLQEETEQFRERLVRIEAEMEFSEESSQGKLQITCGSLNKWLQYFHHSDPSSPMNEKLLDEILQDIKNLINILEEDLEQFRGEVHLRRTESLRSAVRLQEHWAELGQTLLDRHKDSAGVLSPQHAALEEITQTTCELYRQYNIRISGNNGTIKFLTALLKSMKDWLFKVQKLKRGSGTHEAELQAFYRKIPAWLAQVDAAMSCIGSSQLHQAGSSEKPHFPVVPREFFKMIQQWVLSLNTEVEKKVTYLTERVTELHHNLTMWLVNLLKYLAADRLSWECPPRQNSDTEMDEELRLLGVNKLQHEAEELVAEMCRYSGSIISCCRDVVDAIVRKKRAEMDSEADFELKELNKIKAECCNWIQACSLLLSEIRGTPISILHLEDLRNLFGSEEELRNLYRSEEKLRYFFGSEEEQRNLFGSEEEPRSLFGSEEEPRSLFGSEEEPRSLFGSEEEPRSLFGSEEEPRSLFGSEEEPRSLFGSEEEPRSLFGSEEEPRSLFGSEEEPRSLFGSEEEPRSLFGSEEEPRSLFGSEDLQPNLKLKDTLISSTQEELEAEDAITEEETSEVKEETAILQQQPGAGTDSLTDNNEATADMIRYVGHDSNVHLKSLKSDIVLVTGREMTASKPSTPFSQKEFEALAMLEHLQAQVLEREIRAQNAEERSEDLEKKLEEALQRIKDLEIELEKEGEVIPEAIHKEEQEECIQESVSEVKTCSSPKASTSGQSKKPKKKQTLKKSKT